MAKVDGKVVKVGDWVSFKSDIEQSGRIVAVKQSIMGKDVLVLENQNGFDGEYIGGETMTQEMASDCWLE